MHDVGAIPLQKIIDLFSYWVAFWTIVNMLLPPRELFTSEAGKARYNKVLMIVNYYGALNIRGVVMKLYTATQQNVVSSETLSAPVETQVEENQSSQNRGVNNGE